MSKTSGRKAAKKRNRERRGLFATHAVVGYEKHAAVVRELERVSAVLHDLVEERNGAAVPARQVVSWVRNPVMVAFLLAQSPADRNGECSGGADNPDWYCGGDENYPHRRTCKVVAAWRALGDPRADLDLENCMEEAHRLEQQRIARIGQKDIRHRPGPPMHFVSNPNVPPGTAYLMNPADFPIRLNNGSTINPGPSPGSLFGLEPSSYDLWRGDAAATDPVDALAYARRALQGEWPAGAQRIRDEADRSATTFRAVSDARGMDAVEAEARHLNIVFQMPF